MSAVLRLFTVAAFTAALAIPAFADDRQTNEPPSDQQQKAESSSSGSSSSAAQPAGPSMRDLLNQGYVINQATFIPHDAVKRGGSTVDVDAMMFLLTKGTAVATCYTDFQSYTSGSFVTLGCNEYK
jgi:hypothetical protein